MGTTATVEAVMSLRADVRILKSSISASAALEPKAKITEKIEINNVADECANSIYDIRGTSAHAIELTYSYDLKVLQKENTKDIVGNYDDVNPLHTFCSPQKKSKPKMRKQ